MQLAVQLAVHPVVQPAVQQSLPCNGTIGQPNKVSYTVRAQLALQHPQASRAKFRNSAGKTAAKAGLGWSWRQASSASCRSAGCTLAAKIIPPRGPWLTAHAGSAASSRLEQLRL